MIVYNDTFTDTAGTLLTAHVGETGAVYSIDNQEGTQNGVITDQNRLRARNGDGNFYALASGVPLVADITMTATFYCKTVRVSQFTGFTCRDNNNIGSRDLIRVLYQGGAPAQWILEKRVAGVLTQLGNFLQDLSADTAYAVVLTVIGDTKTLLIDGVQRIQVTDAAVSAKGRLGIYFFDDDGATPPSDSNGVQIANITAETAGQVFLLMRP